MQIATPFLGLTGGSNLGASPVRTDTMGSDPDEDLIPTAIVIKNIPFAVKKEQLVQIMTDLGLPLPYAFNYHFDNGIFRGLAFANFTSADETAAVIDMLNHYELQGRKLRVEYKKMLPAAERERIEREKRERRGQLEEQHRPVQPSLHAQPSMASLQNLPGTSPSPVSARGTAAAIDMNDLETLQFYTKLAVFKERQDSEVMILPPDLTPQQRRTVHTLAHHMGLAHMSKGVGENRSVHVYKQQPNERLSPPVTQMGNMDSQRRTLNRAATTDFNDVRNGESGLYGLRQQASGYLPAFQSQNNTNNNLSSNQNLRGAKSFADLRSYTPSPVPSTASFPASLSNNVARLQEQAREANNATSAGLSGAASAFSSRDDGLLVNGLGSLNIGNGFGNSPRALRGMVSFDRSAGDGLGAVGTIGGHRSFTTANHFDEQSRDRNTGAPSRQPRGPAVERGTGFGRNRQNGHNKRGSDEFSQQSIGIDVTSE